MKLQKIFRSNSGFSMVEISVAMGLLGLASLAVMNLSDQVSTSTKRAETMLSKSQFASALGGYMYSASACDELKGMAPFSTTSATGIVLNQWKVAGYNEGEMMKDIGSGKKFRNFTLKTLTGSLDGTPGLPIVQINGINHTKTFLNVRAEVEVKMNPKLSADDPAGKKSYEYFFNIPVLATGAGKVAFCNEEKTIQETCIAMKGKFVDGQCELEKTCNVQGTYARLTCSPMYAAGSTQTCSASGGGNTPNPISNGMYGLGCPPGITAVQTGTKTWSHIGTCSGKKCSRPTITDTLSYHACLDCPGL